MKTFIKFYQRFVSPFFHEVAKVLSGNPHQGCRFIPTCSQYTEQAFERYGTLKALWLSFKRICRCHPFSKGGWDPP